MILFMLKGKYREVLTLCFVFCFFLVWSLLVLPINLDEIWNYGFSYAIALGEVPYLDFNLVITPFFSIFMAFFLYIFGNNILVFNIVFALIFTGMFYILLKLIDEKIYVILFFLTFPLAVLFPSYNLFLLFGYFLLIYLEKNNGNDYFIGLVLAILIMTKQTVGLMLVLPSLYYWKRKDKIFKRFVGCSIPIIAMILYLYFSKAIIQFFDLCFLGLFDFATGNGKTFNIFVLLTLIFAMFDIYFIVKDKKNIYNYYFLAFVSMAIPLFDLYHFELVFVAFLVLLFMNYDINIKLNLPLFFLATMFGFAFIVIDYRTDSGKLRFSKKLSHFETRLVTESYIDKVNSINKLADKYSSKKIVFISADGYFYKIINNLKIDYLDLINTGNHGYNGSKKLLNKIKNCSNCIFFVNPDEYGKGKQSDQAVLKYVIDTGDLLDNSGEYYVYEIKSKDK